MKNIITTSPQSSLDWQSDLNKRKFIFFIISLILAGLAFYLSYKILSEKNKDWHWQRVVVSTKNISESHTIATTDFIVKEMPLAMLPEGFISDQSEVIGKISQHSISVGEVIVDHSIKPILRNNSLASKLDNDYFAWTLNPDWFKSPLPPLKEGDFLNIMASFAKQSEAETSFIASNLKVIAIRKSKEISSKQEVTISVNSAQAAKVLEAYNNKAKLIAVLTNI